MIFPYSFFDVLWVGPRGESEIIPASEINTRLVYQAPASEADVTAVGFWFRWYRNKR